MSPGGGRLSDVSTVPDPSSIRVVCRVRPQNKIETSRGGKLCVRCERRRVLVEDPRSGRVNRYNFDGVFSPDTTNTQEDLYEECGKPMVEQLFQGFNATIFAYGQTSSGKTHTMMGPSLEEKEFRGIIPRVCFGIFDRIYEASDMEFTVKVSYVEIYMERLRDLLKPSNRNLMIRESKSKGIYVENMAECYVQGPEEMFDLMDQGMKNRATSATGMNEGSSRSHSVFIVEVNQKDVKTGSSKRSQLFLVDLAGSEMVRKTNASGQQLEEAKQINKSLSSLGMVIKALTEGEPHIPYRNSKLTRMLQESLGGNARTCLIICCSPSSYNCSETVSTCGFGSRAKKIKNKARINQQLSAGELQKRLKRAEAVIATQAARIKTLEGLLEANGIEYELDAKAKSICASYVSLDSVPSPTGDMGGARLSDISTLSGGLAAQLKEAQDDLLDKSDELESLTKVLQEREDADAEWNKQKNILIARMSELRQSKAEIRSRMSTFTRAVCDALKNSELLVDAKALRLFDDDDGGGGENKRNAVDDKKGVASKEAANAGETTGDNENEKSETIPTLEPASSAATNDGDEDIASALEKEEEALDAAALKEFQEKIVFEVAESVLVKTKLTQVNEQLSKDLDLQQRELEKARAADQEALREAKQYAKDAVKGRDDALQQARHVEQKVAELTGRLGLVEKESKDKDDHIAQLRMSVDRAETRDSEIVKKLEKVAEGLRRDLSAERKEALEKQSALQRSKGYLEEKVGSLESNLKVALVDVKAAKQRNKMLEALDTPVNRLEREKYKAVNKRLGQLVGVHRKLLRKYATLELEIAEARHKLALRDERMRHLEQNARQHTSNMHTQAELHAKEMARLRDQHAKEVKSAKRKSFTKSRLDNGNAVIKPIRGGEKTSLGASGNESGMEGEAKPGFFASIWRGTQADEPPVSGED
eukprot:g2094.t1